MVIFAVTYVSWRERNTLLQLNSPCSEKGMNPWTYRYLQRSLLPHVRPLSLVIYPRPSCIHPRLLNLPWWGEDQKRVLPASECAGYPTWSYLQSSQFITVLSLVGRRPEEGDVLPVSKFCLRMCWVNKFSDVPDCEKFFLDGQTPNLPGILDGGTVQNQNRYKPICQKYKTIYKFATLYDTFNKIPVFSAYNFTGPGCNRTSQTWMIEPQLENFNIKEMKTQQELKMLNNKTDIRVDHQAADADYSATISSMDLDRGHLFPCKATPDDDTVRSTFTLTNVVPQERGFNRGRWCKMEGRFRVALMNCKNNNDKIEAYVVTGAVPSDNNVILNNRVNIPDLMWTAFCCYNNKIKKWMAGAYWGENKKDNGKILNLETLGALEVKLKKNYNVDVKVFHDKCPRKVNVQQVESVEEEPGKKREGSGEGSNKMERTSGELKERDDEDRWQ